MFSRQVMPADAENFNEHAGPSRHAVEGCSATVTPGDRDFLYCEPELARQKKNFGIKSPALNLLQRKDGLCGPALEGFEPALRVRELQPESDSKQHVENASEQLPVQRLALCLQLSLQPA